MATPSILDSMYQAVECQICSSTMKVALPSHCRILAFCAEAVAKTPSPAWNLCLFFCSLACVRANRLSLCHCNCQTPMLIPACSHTFCSLCIRRYVEAKAPYGECPTCRTKTTPGGKIVLSLSVRLQQSDISPMCLPTPQI